ncbi:AdoMet dependent proline di-methyltransferase-domain-containing protein [Ochromonadaceae sp. CCMP2298]|nr:AdoMet dependent proline di-methyltransferase-domain-containing protein [Ochromonadaceae sp. CCMP2298]|mmetsp:Transcript_21507/g.47839  ORF Transcript_21507/g.47839 Transcript_21507/m.47839 type:complete len:333 (+) Transcript_21507:61-1059(+)
MASFENAAAAYWNGSSTLTHSDVEEMLVSVIGEVQGMDTDDNEYDSILTLWKSELKSVPQQERGVSQTAAEEKAKESLWYNKAFDYWESETNCPITDDGVLGGYGQVTPMDARDSHTFLDRLPLPREAGGAGLSALDCSGLRASGKAADCGAGIGRVARNVLLPRFHTVDLVEQSPRLLAAAQKYLARASYSTDGDTVSVVGAEEFSSRVGLLNQGLQNFAPAPGTYDVIWIQWVIGHLHDLDCVDFFRRCAQGLTEGGCIILKDNMLLQSGLTFLWDLQDSSVARHIDYMRLLLTLAGLQIVLEVQQTDFPDELFPVLMLAITNLPRTLSG